MVQSWHATTLGLLFFFNQGTGEAAEGEAGSALLEKNCGRCHALAAGALSPLKEAPNLWIVLRSFPSERLEFELSEGIGSRHKTCRRFSSHQKKSKELKITSLVIEL